MLGYDLTFLTYKLPNFGRFEWEIFRNFGMSENRSKAVRSAVIWAHHQMIGSSFLILIDCYYKEMDLQFLLTETNLKLKVLLNDEQPARPQTRSSERNECQMSLSG